MEERIRELLYNEEEGLMVRIRNGCEELTKEEETELLAFAKDVNKKIKDKTIAMGEVLTCMDVIHYFMWYPSLREVATMMHSSIVNGIDF